MNTYFSLNLCCVETKKQGTVNLPSPKTCFHFSVVLLANFITYLLYKEHTVSHTFVPTQLTEEDDVCGVSRCWQDGDQLCGKGWHVVRIPRYANTQRHIQKWHFQKDDNINFFAFHFFGLK